MNNIVRATLVKGKAKDGVHPALITGNSVVTRSQDFEVSTDELYVKGVKVPCVIIVSQGYYYVDFSRTGVEDVEAVPTNGYKPREQDLAELTPIQIPRYGTYTGRASGYICKFDVDDITFNVKTQVGTRGVACKCKVHVMREGIYVDFSKDPS